MLLKRLCLVFIFYTVASMSAYAAKQPFSKQYKETFTHFINKSLRGKGRKSFDKMVKKVENNIQWHDQKTKNKYLDAYERSLPFMRKLGRDDVPKMVFLIPYLESTWHGKKGTPTSDYGYWQMVPEVINEIRKLDQASDRLMKASANKARTDVTLSTEAALIHLHRYYFYFRHVAGFTEEDAWLFSMTAFNWGAGNIKATIATMKKKGKKVTFSSFYHYLYTLNINKKGKKKRKNQSKEEVRSSRVALEYLPNLWNIVLLIQPKRKLAKK